MISKNGRSQDIAVARSAPALLHRLVPFLIFGVTILVFLPTLRNGFVDWDDYKSLVENKNYRGLGWQQIRWMFTTLHMGHYQPLSWLTFALDYLVWDIDPFGYHLTNLVIHAVNAVLFYFVALRLLIAGGARDGASGEAFLRVAAGFAALFFAIHPLRVESVAWATERRDVLSGLFFLLTIWCYLKTHTILESDGARRRWFRIGTLTFYVLALISKAITVTIPLVMLIIDAYPLGRLGRPATWIRPESRTVWLEKIPFLLLAMVVGMNALFAQKDAGLRSIESYDLLPRLAQAVFGIVFYLWKTVVPVGLSPLYELPVQLDPWDWPFVLSGFIVLTISACLYLVRKTWPSGLATWLYYLVVVFPMLGITQSGPQITADRYSYLSCLGWAVLAGAALQYCWRTGTQVELKRERFIFSSLIAAAVVLICGLLTWRQIPIWRDSESLWKHAIAVGYESSTVHYNLAYVLHKHGNLEGAIDHYRKSLSFNPTTADTHYYLGDALAEQGVLKEATQHYRRAITIRPHFWGAHYNLAIVLERQGKFGEAARHYREALKSNPSNPNVHNSLAMVLLKHPTGEGADEAIERFQDSLKLDPHQSSVYFTLGNVLAMQGRFDEAIANFRQTVRVNPGFAPAYYNLGRVFAAQGQFDQAIESFRQALAIEPKSVEIYSSLSQALKEQSGKATR